jgi:hypothetical protein
MGPEQGLNPAAESLVSAARLIEAWAIWVADRMGDESDENLFRPLFGRVHGGARQ